MAQMKHVKLQMAPSKIELVRGENVLHHGIFHFIWGYNVEVCFAISIILSHPPPKQLLWHQDALLLVPVFLGLKIRWISLILNV